MQRHLQEMHFDPVSGASVKIFMGGNEKKSYVFQLHTLGAVKL